MSEQISSSLKYDLDKGCGTPLGELPCFLIVNRRKTAAWNELESALEPLHRLVYGRSGVTGERRQALERFKGFPPQASAQVEAKLGNLKKEKLRQMIKALGIRQHVSSKIEEVKKGVALFLMSPRDDGIIKLACATNLAKTRRSPLKSPKCASAGLSSRKRNGSCSEDQSLGETKRKKVEPSSSSQDESTMVHADSVKVATFKRVLRMSPEERKSLGAKALRLEIEAEFGLSEGALKPLKNDIVETAMLVVHSLLEAEQRATMVDPSSMHDSPPPPSKE